MVRELPPYEERVPKDSYDMPMRYYHINSSNPNDLKMFAHWHNEIEIQLFEKGHAVSTIDNTEVEAEEDDIVFIPSQSIHFGCADLPVLNVHSFRIINIFKFSIILKTFIEFNIKKIKQQKTH